ncbi:cellulose biosynthesis protein BcsQ [Klebsiella pneumoniae]|nr:cellulose biosynthesis protein BcsQ [Klebsiella pneumoniae]
MAILGLQGVRGGTGVTSITAALAWALQLLGESVLAIDASPGNLLRLFFYTDIPLRAGWARALCHGRGGGARALVDGRGWREGGLRYTQHIDLLPFGQLSAGERENVDQLQPTLGAIAEAVQQLQGQYRWLLLDLPAGYSPLTRGLLTLCDRSLVVVHPDANSHIRLHQQPLPANGDILINDLRVGSQLQEDLYQLWLESQPRILPVTIHRDEAMAECLAAKQPLGEYRQDSLAAEEVLTLANWCLIHYSAGRAA